jgi:hypothetical protein
VDKAVDVASRPGAMLTAIAFEVEIASATGLASGGFIDSGGMIEAERRKSALAADPVLAAGPPAYGLDGAWVPAPSAFPPLSTR